MQQCGRHSTHAISLLLLQGPCCALRGWAWITWTVSLSQIGAHAPGWNWADRGTSPNLSSLLSQISSLPLASPQTGLRNSVNAQASTGKVKLSEGTAKLTGGWTLLDPLPETNAHLQRRWEDLSIYIFLAKLPISVHLPSWLSAYLSGPLRISETSGHKHPVVEIFESCHGEIAKRGHDS